MMAVEVAQLPCPGLDDLALGLLHRLSEPINTVASGDGVDGRGLRSVLFEDGLEYGIYFVAIGTVEAFAENLLLNVGQGTAALPIGAPLTGEEGVRRRGRGGTGCSTWQRSDV